jgi:hypothetical protein
MQLVRRSLVLPLATFALLTAALIAPGDGVRAGTPAFTSYYADPAGDCDGLTPCFTSIQEAVDNSSGPGGSQVFAFPGVYEQDIDLTFQGSSVGGSTGDLRLTAVDGSGQPAVGTATVRGGTPLRAVGFSAGVTIEGFIFEALTGDCVLIASSAAITVTDSTANACGDGSDDGSETGDDGFDLKTTSAEGVTMSGVEASGHIGIYADGIDIVSVGPVTISNATANDNTGPDDADGIDIYETVGDVTLSDITANGNAEGGVFVETSGNTAMTNMNTQDNGDTGAVALLGLSFVRVPGIAAVSGSNLAVSGLVSSGNEVDGLFAAVSGTATIVDSILDANEDDGAELSADGVSFINSTAVGNGEDGIRAEVATSIEIDRATLIGNGAALPGQRDGTFITPLGPSIEMLSVTNSIVANNFGSGVKVDALAGAAHVLRGNAFCGHPEEGFGMFDSSASVDARGNWWGDASGPVHPGNPGALGDTVIDGANGGGGTVSYDPWVSELSAALAGDAFAGVPVSGSAAFRTADSLRLEEGPGSALVPSPPFAVTTLNGETQTTGFLSGGALSFAWTPAEAGQAKVAIVGPCDLTTFVEADVGEGGMAAVWGDDDCQNGPNPVDSLLTLRFDAGLSANTCFEMGTTYEIASASPHPWGDVDCSGGVDPVDSLKLLRFDAGLSVAQAEDCPLIGSDVLVRALP